MMPFIILHRQQPNGDDILFLSKKQCVQKIKFKLSARLEIYMIFFMTIIIKNEY